MTNQPIQTIGVRAPFWAALGLLVSALPSLAAPPMPGAAKPGAGSRLRPAGANRSPALAQRCGYKQATAEELHQFHNEIRRSGWKSAYIATMPIAYEVHRGKVEPVGSQFATLFGDVDGGGDSEWVVAYYVRSETPAPGVAGGDGMMMPDGSMWDERSRLVVFKRGKDGHWKIGWRSPGLGTEFCTPQYNIDEVEKGLEDLKTLSLPVALTDVDADGRAELVYQCRSQSPTLGQLPGVYRFDAGRWVSVAPQADRFSLQDVNGDRKLEIVAGSPYVGYGTGDDDVPRVWQWNGRQYEEASSNFPAFYTRLVSRYLSYKQRMQQKSDPSFKVTAWERAIQKASSLAG